MVERTHQQLVRHTDFPGRKLRRQRFADSKNLYICLHMNKRDRKASFTSLLVTVIWLCSIVCSVVNAFGAVGAPQDHLILKKETQAGQFTTQLAEKAESETDSKHQTPLFVIQTAVHVFWFGQMSIAGSGHISNTHLSESRSLIPLYLARRTLRI